MRRRTPGGRRARGAPACPGITLGCVAAGDPVMHRNEGHQEQGRSQIVQDGDRQWQPQDNQTDAEQELDDYERRRREE